MMEHCRIITFEEMQAMQKQGDAFRPFPVWVEANMRYVHHPVYWMPLAPAILSVFYEASEDGNAEVYVEGGGTFELLSYGKSWRLWYACGTERPSCDVPWMLFSWDNGQGDRA